MHNQHAGLSQTLAAQHTTRLRQQATRQRLLCAVRPPHQRTWSPRRWWQLLDHQTAPRTN